MIVHKCCRKLVMFDCMDNNKSIFDQYEVLLIKCINIFN